MIVPTIGRVVWYHGTPPTLRYRGPGYQPEAAIVAFVHNERLVNLAVFNQSGELRGEVEVRLLQGDEPREPALGSYAEWMPYQKGQAAKHDAGDALATGYQKLTWPRE